MWFVARSLIQRGVIRIEDLDWMLALTRVALTLIVRDMATGAEVQFD